MKGIGHIYTILILAAASIGGAYAQSVDMWFGDSEGNRLTSVNVAQGDTFGVSIWYQTSDTWEHNAIELLVGFDRATSVGSAATPIDGEIALVGVDNISFPTVLANNLGGGFSPTAGDRPYGARLALGAALGNTVTAVSPVRIADIVLRNQAIPEGGFYNMTIWNAGDGVRWTSFAPMMSSVRRDATPDTLTVNSVSVPEYTIEQWKKLADGELGKLVGAEVTIDVGDSFFVESADRSAGIRVAKLGTSVYTPGVRATITGTIETNSNGERYIASSAITSAAQSRSILPLGTINRALGGSNWNYNSTTGAGQIGVTGADDLNNVGLLVRAWGKPVLTGSPDSFVLDDGSGVEVTVQLPSGQTHAWTAGTVPAYVSVTGASGLKKTGAVAASAIYIGSFAADIKTVSP